MVSVIGHNRQRGLDFGLGETADMLVNTVSGFAQGEIAPRADEIDRTNTFPRDLWPKMGALGLHGITVEEEWGGAGLGYLEHCLSMEQISRASAAVGLAYGAHSNLCVNQIRRWGTEEQKRRYCPKLAQSWVGAYALSEAGSGSDAFALACRATDRGDHWELTGRKLWITNAAEAELFIILATVDPAKGYKGITAFLVERTFPGFQVGKKEDKLGIRASSTCELILEGVRVPRENVLGEVGKGYKIAIETLNEGRIGIGAQMVGVAQGSFDHGLRYAQERQQFGKPISEFQGVQFLLSELATDIEASRLLTYNAARLRDTGSSFIKEAAMSKLFASRAAEHVTSKVIEIFGGYGFTREYPVEKYFRDQKVGQIYEGTTHMQLLVIAKQLLGKLP
jgi:alkylation response protein AidB-like acyl-CoA dehydrogenase